jgi:hypothetical protein
MRYSKLLFTFFFFSSFLITIKVAAQVPVRFEPHHRVVLENEYVRLIDVHILPHDTTLTHIHAEPSVIVFLTKATIGTQIVGDTPVIANVKPAQTGYAAYDEKPITHKVWNQGDSLFHVMDIELVKKNPSKDSCALLNQPGIEWQRSQKLVRVYNVHIAPGGKYQLGKSSCAHLLINVTGYVNAFSANTIHSLQPETFIFFPPQSMVEITDNTKENAECVLLEFK